MKGGKRKMAWRMNCVDFGPQLCRWAIEYMFTLSSTCSRFGGEWELRLCGVSQRSAKPNRPSLEFTRGGWRGEASITLIDPPACIQITGILACMQESPPKWVDEPSIFVS